MAEENSLDKPERDLAEVQQRKVKHLDPDLDDLYNRAQASCSVIYCGCGNLKSSIHVRSEGDCYKPGEVFFAGTRWISFARISASC